MSNVFWKAAAAVWLGVIWYLSDQPNLSSGLSYDFFLRKVAHMGEYALLLVLLVKAQSSSRPRRRAVIYAATAALAYAALDEWHQTSVTGRTGTIRDVSIDSVGIIAASLWFWLWPRRKHNSFKEQP